MSIKSESIIEPNWPAPERVKALVTTRGGGVSRAPFDTFNMGLHVDDDPDAVLSNRAKLQQIIGTRYKPQWLQQVHGISVVEALPDDCVRQGDGVFTRQAQLPCAVMTADCLPVFFCDAGATQVAVAHAGWRGLAAGVLEATLAKFNVPGNQLMAWLGPAIGPSAFEVGAEVRESFLQYSSLTQQAFVPNPARPEHWFADLYLLARLRLAEQGIERISGGGFCTLSDANRFYSYRRENVTGRMASLIWLD